MATANRLALGGLVSAVSIISATYCTSPVPERPTQSAILALLISGSLLYLLQRRYPKFLASTISWNGSALPLRNDSSHHDPKRSLQSLFASILYLKALRGPSLVAVALFICLRVEAFRFLSWDSSCTTPGLEGILAVAFAFYEYHHRQKGVPLEAASSTNDALPSLFRELVYGRARYILPAVLLTLAQTTLAFAYVTKSTYICPLATFWATSAKWLQFFGITLDAWIVVSFLKLFQEASDSQSATIVLSQIFLLAATFLSFGGVLGTVTHVQYWKWIFGVDARYVFHVAWYSMLMTIVIVCTIRLLPLLGIMPIVLLTFFLCIYTTSSIDALDSRGAFPPTILLPGVAGIVFACLAITLVWHAASVWDTHKSSMGSQRTLPISFTALSRIVAGLFLIHIYLQFSQHQTLDYHPIDLLLQESSVQAKAWADQASVSKSIGDAVAHYRGRYGRYPPPRFDVWYEYAKERSSLVIDDFDDIYRDLEPFWTMSPAEIRLRTGEMLSDPWNEVADIVIRKGKAEIGPKILATHRWMLEGIIAQIKPFAQHLPDMDLAFNINDEPRIAIPYHRKGKAQAPKAESELPIDQWSSSRNDDWPLIESPVRTFTDWSFNRNFHGFGSVVCPPTSAARQNSIWDPTILCTSCATSHSLDGFLSNWTLSGSPCHQPDLTNLHGFYLSPAAFKPSHELYPVFSQSKAQGYSDILYPSAWNYVDKAKYEPSNDHPDLPFAEKNNTLFWRGATSEGVSRYGAWKGMVRQRLVHLTNNLTSNARIPLLLPHGAKPGKYEYQYLHPSDLEHTDLTTDIGIVDSIARCWDSDCAHQEAEFGLVGKIDFQAHWRYRYLFDMDGAGFSGRFLPFLQSRSLPFKTALFREWYDSRLTAWKHFVPLDLRLHGVYSTLAYFAGVKTDKQTVMQGKVKEAERIAEEGREWAGKVLRKEDMEIYMFRLLLEWARLTDDNRDRIGFSG